MDEKYYIHGINGPVITVRGGRGLSMMSLVYVGEQRLPGEVVGAHGEFTTVQVYEDAGGLVAGAPVYPTDAPLEVMLGPGMLGNVYDGIARPLKAIEARAGAFITKGISLPALDLERRWDVKMEIREGDSLAAGQVFAGCQETEALLHR